MDAELHFNGTCISSVVKRKQLEKFHVEPKDLDGIVSTLRSTAGVEAAVFVYPNENDTYKVSLRSASYVDVAAIAVEFGGGGHCRQPVRPSRENRMTSSKKYLQKSESS